MKYGSQIVNDCGQRSQTFVLFWCWVIAELPEWKSQELALYLILGEQQIVSTLDRRK
jgi:hypothetical protein